MNEFDYGYIKLHRKILNSRVFRSEKTLKIWIWCLLKANFVNKWICLKIGKGSTEVEVKRGQFIFGRSQAEEELNINGNTVYKHMKKLEKMGNILINSNNQYSVVSVCNYDSYQSSNNIGVSSKEQPNNNDITTEEQVSNTTNKVKNDNKEKINPEYAVFIETFNRLTGKIFSGDEKSKIQFDTLLSKGYALTDIEKAVTNCLTDDFHKNNPKFLTPEFITRIDKLEMYLNAVAINNRPANLKGMVF